MKRVRRQRACLSRVGEGRGETLPRYLYAVAGFILATGSLSLLIRWESGEYAPWVNTYAKVSIPIALAIFAVALFIYVSREPPAE